MLALFARHALLGDESCSEADDFFLSLERHFGDAGVRHELGHPDEAAVHAEVLVNVLDE